tara:strand:+ start:306 stop:800 length:495 start_codon:yes stop_codon:yes gene_type:complete
MNIKYAVKNNFLKKEDFENIKNMVMGENFPWYFGDNVAHAGKHESHFCWIHTFFRHGEGIISSAYNLLDPLLKKLKVKALIRVRANLYSNQGKIIEHESHTDYPFKHKGALFSLNTCNGFTALKDNTKIKSVANRILLLDPSLSHHSSTSTDAKVRCNININYF